MPTISSRPLPRPLPASPRKAAASPPQDPAEWTVLVYLNGHNNLEPDEVRNVLDMQKVGSNGQVKVAVQLARGPQQEVHPHAHHDHLDGDWAGVKRFLVPAGAAGDATTLAKADVEDLPDSTDMGDPASLTDFIKWGVSKFPAKHYMVVVNDHGAGFRGASWDDEHNSHFQMPGLKKALKAAGVKPDVLLFDACEMEQTEVAYQFRNEAHFMVGSEEIVGSVGMPYSKFIGMLHDNPQMTAADLSKSIVDTAGTDEAMRRSEHQEDGSVELSAVDLGAMGALRGSCDDLAKSIVAAGVPRTVLAKAISGTKHFNLNYKDHPGADYRDLGDFAQHLLDSPSVAESVKQSARQLQAQLKQTVIGMEKEGKGQEHDSGLSVYLPLHYGHDKQKAKPDGPPPDPHWGYQHLDMSKQGAWQDLLNYIAG